MRSLTTDRMSHFLTSFAMILSIFFLPAHADKDPLTDFDAGFVKGLQRISPLISSDLPGEGEVEYHIGTFNFRRAVANQFADRLDANIPSLSGTFVRDWLNDFAAGIRKAPQGGSGDLGYWRALLSTQHVHLANVVKREGLFARALARRDKIAPDELIGFLRGLRVGVGAMIDLSELYEDIGYYIRLFDLQRQNIHFVASVMNASVDHVEDPFVRMTLSELAKDLRAIPHTGRGDLRYWSGPLRDHQIRVTRRVIEKLDALISLAEAHGPSCGQVLAENGLIPFRLEEI